MRRFTRYLSWSEIHRIYRLTAPEDVGRNAPGALCPWEEFAFGCAFVDDGCTTSLILMAPHV